MRGLRKHATQFSDLTSSKSHSRPLCRCKNVPGRRRYWPPRACLLPSRRSESKRFKKINWYLKKKSASALQTTLASPLSLCAPCAGFRIAAFLQFCTGKVDREVHGWQKSAFYANIGKHQLRFLRLFKGCLLFFFKRGKVPPEYRPRFWVCSKITRMLRSWKYLLFSSIPLCSCAQFCTQWRRTSFKGSESSHSTKQRETAVWFCISEQLTTKLHRFPCIKKLCFLLHLLHHGCWTSQIIPWRIWEFLTHPRWKRT